MGFRVPRGSTLLFVFVFATIISSTSGGGQRKFFSESKAHVGVVSEDQSRKFLDNKKTFQVHPRVLKVQTNDYGNYDSAPALVKPPFKFIPN